MSALEELLIVHHAGSTQTFTACPRGSASWFGGPRTRTPSGVEFGPASLHSIAHLSHVHVPALVGGELPLVYGLAFDGCVLRYRYASDAIDVEAIEPARSAEDWPYPDYPALLPYVPLEPLPSRREAWAEFAARLGLDASGPLAPLVVVVPPPATIGHSLWGPDGDAEGATIVFACDPNARRVHARNVCA